jgi:hypothetical protein
MEEAPMVSGGHTWVRGFFRLPHHWFAQTDRKTSSPPSEGIGFVPFLEVMGSWKPCRKVRGHITFNQGVSGSNPDGLTK